MYGETLQSVSPHRVAVQQNSIAVLPYIHCNDHRANDFSNHSLPNMSFGSENNRIIDCFRHPKIIIAI